MLADGLHLRNCEQAWVSGGQRSRVQGRHVCQSTGSGNSSLSLGSWLVSRAPGRHTMPSEDLAWDDWAGECMYSWAEGLHGLLREGDMGMKGW